MSGKSLRISYLKSVNGIFGNWRLRAHFFCLFFQLFCSFDYENVAFLGNGKNMGVILSEIL